MRILPGSDVSQTWRLDPPWARLYSFGMARPVLARAVGTVGFGTDLKGLYDAIGSVGDVPAGGTVLDVPCGAGIALRGLWDAPDVRYLAADISPTMLGRTRREAARRGVRVEAVQADVTRLPLPDRSVDLVLCLTGLHCFPDPERAVVELARVARDRIELTWLRSDAGLRYRPVVLAGRTAGVLGPSLTADDVGLLLGRAGFDVRLQVQGAFAYASARR